ncbi:hypothetical protein GILI108418_17225 [Gillisia limnaea]
METVPSESDAVAVMLIEAGEVKLALFKGAVIATAGATFAGSVTTIVIVSEVVSANLSSVAFAVNA